MTSQAAGKQPTDIDVKCGAFTSYYQEPDVIQSLPYDRASCRIIVTYDDWSTDVASVAYDQNGTASIGGQKSQIVLDGGYKAKSYCTIPYIFSPGDYSSSSNYSAVNTISTTCVVVGLKTKPVDRPSTASVMQMPTTGAPEGLSTVGMVAVGLGLLAVGVGLVKRERI